MLGQRVKHYTGDNFRLDFDVVNPDEVLAVPNKSNYLNDIGGPKALGGARQRVPKETILLENTNPTITPLFD